ncbi:ABC transporter permease [Allonocardiopsis opalescens]|uniref:Transport permease protein n=1 Tax=Allonocardiopsis opalescens TaxID=1144618 RepID=A0A2T0PUG8_9ACTN|nr:ABC transporter permease [Allonocardiopsis opalescens]PRX92448.1 oleandomycin transport system permease protein [Allonocardiopsis opalescens]
MTTVSQAVTPERISPINTIQHGLIATSRSLLRLRSNPAEIIGLTFQPLMFVALFVFVFGQALMGSWQDYRDFVLPGIIVQMVAFATIGTGMTLFTDIDKGIFDRFRSLPIARSAPLIGAVLGDLVRYVLSLVVILVVGFLIGFRPPGGVVGTLAGAGVVLIFALALCWIWVYLGLIAKTAMTLQMYAMTLMFPLTFGGSTFVSPEQMPDWMAWFASVNPVTSVTDTVRGLMLGGPVAGPFAMTLLWSAAIAVVFFPLAVRAYVRRT